MDHRPIDLRIAASTFLVGWAAAIADHGDHEPMLNAVSVVFIACKPADFTDRAGGEQKTVAVTRPYAAHPLGQMGKQRYARAVVVGQRGVADVGGKQELVLSF